MEHRLVQMSWKTQHTSTLTSLLPLAPCTSVHRTYSSGDDTLGFKMSEPSHRLRLSKLWKKNRLESNLSPLGPELVRSKQEHPVCLFPTDLAQFRIVLKLVSQRSPTPLLQSRPGFFKKLTSWFKPPKAVYLARVDGQSIAC